MIQDILDQHDRNDPAAAAPLLRALRTEFVARQKELSPEELRLFNEVVVALLPKVTILERMALSRAAATSPYLPLPVMEKLLSDTTMVATPLLECNPKCPDVYLLKLVDGASEKVLLSLASRKPLSMRVASQIFELATPDIRLALAANVHAELTYDILNSLIDEAVDSPGMDKCLAARSDLPPELAAKLHKIVSGRTQKRVSAMIERDIRNSKPKGIRFFNFKN